jgi:long-chain fatty acid transport protein
MKRTIKLAVVAALALGATSAFATNGSALIGMGAKSRGMAGTSIGISHGAESALSNPALITSVESTEISFGGTLFMPDVEAKMGAETSEKSAADMNVIPEISIASKITDNFYMGIGMWGTAGMGVDYRDVNHGALARSNYRMVTNLQLMQFGVPLAYKTGAFSMAITPLLQYGALDINYLDSTGGTVGAGVSQDLQFGYTLGASYAMSGLTIGAVYKSRIDMTYKGQLSTAVQGFGVSTYTNDKLSTPAEIGLGASYKFGENTVAIDYKQIKWSDAKGYKDFEWDDQNVISLGYEYATDAYALRVGYNYAKSPISDKAGRGATANSAGLSGYAVNAFNLLGFPGVVESHYAVGGTYNVSKTTSFDLAFTYAPEVTNTYTAADLGGTYALTTKHSQTGISAQVNFDF